MAIQGCFSTKHKTDEGLLVDAIIRCGAYVYLMEMQDTRDLLRRRMKLAPRRGQPTHQATTSTTLPLQNVLDVKQQCAAQAK